MGQVKTDRWNSANDCLIDAQGAFNRDDFEGAVKFLKRAVQLGSGDACDFMGHLCELGIGVEVDTNKAEIYYTMGDMKGCVAATNDLSRVNKNGFVAATSSNRRKYIQYRKDVWEQAGVIAYQIMNGIDSGSGSSSSSSKKSNSSSCYICNGTGVDPTPHSGGSRTNWVKYYNTSGTKCPYCGESYSHYHDRCAHCNTPSHY